jgi:Flp pilus assembly protein TadB
LRARLRRLPAWRVWLAAASVPAGVAAALVSGTWAAAVALPTGAALLPPLFQGSGQRARIERMDAIAKWVRNLAGLQLAGLGLEDAINASRGASAPAPIRSQVDHLANRISYGGMDTATALRHFADELDDYTGDLAAAALILGARQRGSGLADVLLACSASVDEQVASRRAIDAERVGPRQEARQMTVIGAVFVAAAIGVGAQAVPVYRSPAGQAVMIACVAVFGLAVWWLRKVSAIPEPPRFIGAAEQPDKNNPEGADND